MVGDDEVRARATLIEMQTRIARGPYEALGLATNASPQQVRAAFLTLTKQFHPARFARMSNDVLRLANEVFLALKGVHEQLLRALGVPTQRSAVTHQSGSIPAISASSSGPIRRTSGAQAAVRPSGTQPPPTPRAPASPAEAIERSGAALPRATGSESMPVQRPTGPIATPTPAATPRPVPPTGSAPIARPPTPTVRPATPPPAQDYAVATVRYAGSPPMQPAAAQPAAAAQRAPAAWDERQAFQVALNLMSARDWTSAKFALHELVTRVPQSRQYRALLLYARGRELEAAGKRDGAAVEYEHALQMDPTLGQAKLALADLKRK